MPVLHIWVSDETLNVLTRFGAERDEQNRSPEQLAEDLVSDAAIRARLDLKRELAA